MKLPFPALPMILVVVLIIITAVKIVTSSSDASNFIFASMPTSEMISIPAGDFVMGCQSGRDFECVDNERPAHNVNIKNFEIGKYEVTQELWKEVMSDNTSIWSECGNNCPAEYVSWEDAQFFINELNRRTGKIYRLPSEAEWEYACRAGENHAYCGSDHFGRVAWVGENSHVKTHPVGQKNSNAWGLYDMSGNVCEWVQDTLHRDYKGAPTDGSAWEGGDTGSRMVRGGSSGFGSPSSRASIRDNYRIPMDQCRSCFGFRLARTLP